MFPSVFPRGYSRLFLKQSAEVQLVLAAHNGGDFGNRAVGGFQKGLGVGYAQGDDILHRRDACVFFELANEPGKAHMAALCVVLNGNGTVVVFVEIVNCGVGFLC